MIFLLLLPSMVFFIHGEVLKWANFSPLEVEECSMEEKLVCKKARKNRETDQHLNFFEKNPRLKVSTMAEFKEYPCPNKGLLFWESIIHFRNLCLSLIAFLNNSSFVYFPLETVCRKECFVWMSKQKIQVINFFPRLQKSLFHFKQTLIRILFWNASSVMWRKIIRKSFW